MKQIVHLQQLRCPICDGENMQLEIMQRNEIEPSGYEYMIGVSFAVSCAFDYCEFTVQMGHMS